MIPNAPKLLIGCLLVASQLVLTSCRATGVRGTYPGPTPTWSESGGTYCNHCGGEPRLSLWTKGSSSRGPSQLWVEVAECLPDSEYQINESNSVWVTYDPDDYEAGIRAVSGSITVHECDGFDARFADVSFDVAFKGGAKLSGRLKSSLRFDGGFE